MIPGTLDFLPFENLRKWYLTFLFVEMSSTHCWRIIKTCWNIRYSIENLTYWSDFVDSLWGWTLQKVPIMSENDSNTNCSELNFLQKLAGRISLSSPDVELGGFKDCQFWSMMMNFPLVFQLVGCVSPLYPIICQSFHF